MATWWDSIKNGAQAVGNAFNSNVSQAANTLSNQGLNRHLFDNPAQNGTLQAFPQAVNQNKDILSVPARYAQNQIVAPIAQGIGASLANNDQGRSYTDYSSLSNAGRSLGNAFNVVAPVAQGVFNATPPGMLFNANLAAGTAVAKSVRERNPRSLLNNFTDMAGRPTSLAQEGLGIDAQKHPIAAGAIDLLGANPEGTINAVRSVPNIKNIGDATKVLTKPLGFGDQGVLKAQAGKNTIGTVVRDYKNAEHIAHAGSTYNAPIPTVSDGMTVNGVAVNNHPADIKTINLPESQAGPALRNSAAKDWRGANVQRDYKPGENMVQLHIDQNTGKLVSWNADRPAFAKDFTNSIYAPRLNTAQKIQQSTGNIEAGLPSQVSMEGAKARTEPVNTDITQHGLPTEDNAPLPVPAPDDLPPKPATIEQAIAETAQRRAANAKDLPTVSMDPNDLNASRLKTSGRGKGVNALDDASKQNFQDWVNSGRQDTLAFEAQKVQQQFKDLPEYAKKIEGPNTPPDMQFIRFQEGKPADPVEGQQFQKLKQYFDQKYSQLQEVGVPVKYQENYLKQMWKGSDKEINEAVDRALSLNPSLSREKVIASYAEGIKAGLVPKTNDLSQIAGMYEKEANRAIADTQYLKKGLENGTFKPKYSEGFKALDHFPDQTLRYEKDGQMIEHTGPLYAPDDIAGLINNHMGKATILNEAAHVASELKNMVLSGGAPGTSWNFHGITTLGRDVLSAGNPLKLVRNAITDVAAMTYNPLNKAYMAKNLDAITELMHSGLTMSTEASGFKSLEPKTGNALQKAVHSTLGAFEDPLFQGFLPATKARFAIEALENMTKRGVSREEALKAASHSANTIFGGHNMAELGADKNVENIYKTLFLAPDTFRSMKGTAAGVVKAITNPKNPEYWAYRSVALNAVAAYTLMTLANKKETGHYMHENAPGHTFEIQLGYDKDGNPRYIRPLGQALDFAKIPIDAVTSIAHGDLNQVARIAQNRLSVPLSQAVQLMSNTGPLGQTITKRTDSAIEKLKKYGANALAGVTPAPIGAVAKYASGQTNAEQSIASGLELPIRYGNAASTKPLQDSQDFMKQQGLSGDQIGKRLETDKNNAAADKATLQGLKTGMQSSSGIPIARAAGSGPSSADSQTQDSKDLESKVATLKSGKVAYQDASGRIMTYANKDKALEAAAKDSILSGEKDRIDLGKKIIVADETTASGIRMIDKSVLAKQKAQAEYSLKSMQAKDKGDYTQWEKLNMDYLGSIMRQQRSLDPVLDAAKIDALEQKKETIGKSIIRYRGYGGSFTKPKAGRGGRGGRGRTPRAGGAKFVRFK